MADIATRSAYGKALLALGEDHEFVVLDADLSGSTQTKVFADKYPKRFINCGIAEGNMMSVAAGIAATGVPAFASSFAMFATGRAFEQIRNSIGYPHLNVKICASHAGVTVGEDGATHQCNEDIAIMRTIPGMTVVCPADAVEATACIKAILEHDGPVYCRLGRKAVPVIFDESYKFTLGKAVPVREGNDCVVFASGITVAEALKAYDLLKLENINISVVNVSTIKPLDVETVVKYAEKAGNVITVEEHSIIGGLGSAISEALSENYPVKVTRIGVNDVFGVSGKGDELIPYFGLNGESIAKAVKKQLGLIK